MTNTARNNFGISFIQRLNDRDVKIEMRQATSFVAEKKALEPLLFVEQSFLNPDMFILSTLYEVSKMKQWNVVGNKVTVRVNNVETDFFAAGTTDDGNTSEIMYAPSQRNKFYINGTDGSVSDFSSATLTLMTKKTREQNASGPVDVCALIDGRLVFAK